jgi:hypothetical protein
MRAKSCTVVGKCGIITIHKRGTGNLKRFKPVPFSFQVVGSIKTASETGQKWVGLRTERRNLL